MIPSSSWPRRRNKSEKKPVRLFLEELEGRCLLSHQITPIGGITTAPDGSIWFLEQDRLGRVDPSTGVIQEFAIGTGTANTLPINPQAGSIEAAPDGSIWFFGNNQVTRFDPSTNATNSFSVPGLSPLGLAVGPDGDAWVITEERWPNWDLVRINPSTGAMQEFPMGQGQGFNKIAIASDGKIWTTADFTALGWVSVEVLNPATGAVQKFSIGSLTAPIDDLIADSSGTVMIMQRNPSEVAPTGTRIVDTSAIGQVLGQKYESDPQAFPGIHGQWAGLQIMGGYREDNTGNIWFVAGALIVGEAGPAGCGFAEFNPTTGAASFFEAPANPEFTLGLDGKIWESYSSYTGDSVQSNIGRFDPATGALTSFSEATDAPPASSSNPAPAAGTSFNATAGIDFKGAVASFTPQTPIAASGAAYQATVSWGDGTTSNLVLTVTANGTYNVVADHTYQTAGTFNVTVTIAPYSTTSGLNSDPLTVFSTANVSENPLNFKPFS